MQVKVKLLMTMKRFAPDGVGADVFSLALPEGSKVYDLICELGIPVELQTIPLDKGMTLDREDPLSDGQEIHILPPISKG